MLSALIVSINIDGEFSHTFPRQRSFDNDSPRCRGMKKIICPFLVYLLAPKKHIAPRSRYYWRRFPSHWQPLCRLRLWLSMNQNPLPPFLAFASGTFETAILLRLYIKRLEVTMQYYVYNLIYDQHTNVFNRTVIALLRMSSLANFPSTNLTQQWNPP